MDMNETKQFLARYDASSVERMRSQAEITARYHQDCERYKALKSQSDGSNHDQLTIAYTELKLLGWVLGKTEKTIIHDTIA
jgi:hypothetical protein